MRDVRGESWYVQRERWGEKRNLERCERWEGGQREKAREIYI